MEIKKILYYITAPIIFVLLWLLISEFALASQVLLPSPIKVIQYLFLNFFSSLINPTFWTLQLWLIGFIVGAMIGLVFGLIIGLSDTLYNFLEVLIDFFRSLPAIVLLPVIVIFLGVGYTPRIFIVIFFTSLYMLVNTIYGVKYGKNSKIILAKILKMSPTQKFKKVIFPSALPSIFVGLRTTISLSLIVSISSEMLIGGADGLGQKVLDDMLVYNLTEMYAIILVIGIFGYFSNKIFATIEHKLIHWKGY
ncbi:MAG: ABC transporter permease subunit [Patescibacteria group bacterium]|nr:ABC transporter permease subunit [Patescibacteria group bacterium]